MYFYDDDNQKDDEKEELEENHEVEDKDGEEDAVNDNDVIEQLKKERDDFKNKYLRALADYQNAQKRSFEDRQLGLNTAKRNLILKFIPFLDNLEKAEVFLQDKGLQLVKDQYLEVLKKEGLTEIPVLNKPYDPFTAEAIDVVEGNKDNMVVEVLEKGYMYQDEVLRHAKVKVSKKIR